MRTSEWNSSLRLKAFSAAIFARAVPQLPEPMTAMRWRPEGSGEGGRATVGDMARSGVVTPEAMFKSSNMGWTSGEEGAVDALDIVNDGENGSGKRDTRSYICPTTSVSTTRLELFP